jgi:hypothetical protein
MMCKLRKIYCISDINNIHEKKIIQLKIKHYLGDDYRIEVKYQKRKLNIFINLILYRFTILNIRIKSKTISRLLDLIPHFFIVEESYYNREYSWAKASYKFKKKEFKKFKLNSNNFTKLLDLKGKSKKVIVLGTGPSLENVENNIQDKTIIACNIAGFFNTQNKGINSDIIVAGDALFHFSDSEYAHEFRKQLLLLHQKKPFIFIYPEIFHGIVQMHLYNLKESLVPIKISKNPYLTINTEKQNYKLPNQGNVLNLLAIPTALFISQNIEFLGFDGRKTSDKGFWRNVEILNFKELLEDLRHEFPQFFQHYIPKGKETNYQEKLEKNLEKTLVKYEKRGVKFRSLNASSISPMNKRFSN